MAEATGDVTKFKAAVEGLEGSVKPVSTAVAGVGEGAAKAVGDVERVTDALTAVAPGAQAAGAALGTTASEAVDMGAALSSATRGASSLGRSLATLALGGSLTAQRLASIGIASAEIGSAISAASRAAATSEADYGRLNRALNATVVSSQLIPPVLSEIGGALIRFAAPTGLAVATVETFVRTIHQWTEELQASNRRVAEWSLGIATATREAKDRIADIQFKIDISGLTTAQQELETRVRAYSDSLQEQVDKQKLARGQAAAMIEDYRKLTTVQLGFIPAMKESQAAGEALHASIRAGAEASIAELERLKTEIEGLPASASGLDVLQEKFTFRFNESTLKQITDLGKELEARFNVKAPTAALVELQKQIDASAQKFIRLGKEATTDLDIVKSQVDDAADLIKRRFAEEFTIKPHFDSAAAHQEVQTLLRTISTTSVTLTPEVNTSLALRQIDVLRSRIVGLAPEDPLRIEFEAEIKRLQATVAEERKKQESTPIRIPVEGGTGGGGGEGGGGLGGAPPKTLDDLRRLLEGAPRVSGLGLGPFGEAGIPFGGGAAVGGVRISGGLPLGPEELRDLAHGIEAGVLSALRQGNAEQARILATQAKGILDVSEGSIRFLNELIVHERRPASPNTQILYPSLIANTEALASLKRSIEVLTPLFGALATVPSGVGGTPQFELFGAIADFTAGQKAQLSDSEQANRLLSQNNQELQRTNQLLTAQLSSLQDVVRTLSSASFSAGITKSGAATIAIATGAR